MIVYLALGSNLGDRLGLIQQAITLLTDAPEIRLISASSFYETEPVGYKDQDWFVNAAIAIETTLPPEILMERCLTIEKKLGRQRNPENKNGPRTLDIDILFYGDLVLNQPELVIPHPRLHERACVLVPLLEVNPRINHPVFQKNIEQLHHELPDPEEVLLYGTRRVFEEMGDL